MIKNLRLIALFTVACLIVIVNSCKKDFNKDHQSATSDPVLLEAKTWYESTYPLNKTGKLTIQNISNSADKDYSQFVKPDWKRAKTYKRFDQNVIETPVDPSGKIAFTWQNKIDNRVFYREKYSRSYFLLLNNGRKYDAYIMTVIADSAYVKNDLSKLDHNTYNKRDSDFSGVVIYHTPKGKYVSGWSYSNGHINTKVRKGSNTAVQSSNGRPLQTNTDETKAQVCVILWEITFIDGVPVDAVEIDRDCYITGGGGGSGGGGSGDTGNNTAPPVPPVPECSDDDDSGTGLHSVHQIIVNTAPTPINPPGGGGGGFPPPNTQPPCTVTVTVPDIIDSLTSKYPCTKALIAALPELNSNIANLLFQTFDSKDGNNIIFLEGNATKFPANSKLDGYTIFDNSSGIPTNKIYISPAVLANSSNEYRIATLYHEAIHAFLSSELIKLKRAGFDAKYPMVSIVERQNFSQVVGADKYDYYIDPAYREKVVGKDHLTMAEYFINDLKDAILAYNPNFPPERALALAQTGIIQSNNASFVAYNDAERDVTTGKSVGKKCTP